MSRFGHRFGGRFEHLDSFERLRVIYRFFGEVSEGSEDGFQMLGDYNCVPDGNWSCGFVLGFTFRHFYLFLAGGKGEKRFHFLTLYPKKTTANAVLSY